MATSMTFEASGRRATAIATDSGGQSFNAFAGAVNTTLPVASGSDWLPLYSGVQALVDGDVSYIRITSTDNLYPQI